VIINNTGEIIENLYMLGHPVAPVYLLNGDRPAIFDTGLTCLGEVYVGEIKKVLGSRQPLYCFITHSHFDHCGSVSIFKENFPSMKVVSSEKAHRIFGRPNAIALIKELNRVAEQLVQSIDLDYKPFAVFHPFETDLTAGKEDIFELSPGLTVRVIETPGHTWDCLSFYIPEKKILFSSEAAGQPDRTGYIVSDCPADYDEYLQSLKHMGSLDVEVLCLGHLFVYTLRDVKGYFRESLVECEKFHNLVANYLSEEQGDLQQVIKRIKAIEYDSKMGIKQPEPAYLLNLEARIKAVQKHIDKTIDKHI
jgi:glyoxylase-like metal-dependent hydrolase (beta-lactamase superfamily II)